MLDPQRHQWALWHNKDMVSITVAHTLCEKWNKQKTERKSSATALRQDIEFCVVDYF